MMVHFMTLSQECRTGWDNLISAGSFSTWFQTPRAYDFYASLPELFEPFAFGVEEDAVLKGAVVGFVTMENGPVKQRITRRAVINGGPLLADDISEEALETLLKGTGKGLSRKAIYIETRNFLDYSRWKDVFIRCGFCYEPHYNFQIDTSSAEVVDTHLGKSRRRDVKYSLRDGAELVEDPSLEQVREFYSVLEQLYKTKVKTPLYPWNFFENIFRHPDGKFILVSFQGRIVGGTACVCQAGMAMYEWFACGEDGMYKNIFPSTLATYGGIMYAVTHGMPMFDMMGAGSPGDGGYGVRDFKAKFGGTLVEHGRFKYICSPLLYKVGCLGVKILKKL